METGNQRGLQQYLQSTQGIIKAVNCKALPNLRLNIEAPKTSKVVLATVSNLTWSAANFMLYICIRRGTTELNSLWYAILFDSLFHTGVTADVLIYCLYFLSFILKRNLTLSKLGFLHFEIDFLTISVL